MQQLTWLTLTAAVVGLVVQLVKSDKLDDLLFKLGLPSIPKRYMPWLALALGLVSGGIQAYLDPSSNWQALILDIVNGAVGGALPVATHELTRKQ